MELVMMIIPILLVLFGVKVLMMRRAKQHPALPPGPWNLPIIGSIHRLLGAQPPHQSLRRLSQVYGPIMHLRLGEITVIIISSAEGAKEIMNTHDIVFASRPVNTSVDILTYGSKGVVFAPYGEFWRQMRRLCALELLSPKRVRSFGAIREEEVSKLVRSIGACSGAINLSEMLVDLSNSIVVRAIIGDRCRHIDRSVFMSVVSEELEFLSGFSITDLFPSSAPLIGRISGYKRRLDRCHQKVDRILQDIIEEHMIRRCPSSYEYPQQNYDQLQEDLVDVLLRIRQGQQDCGDATTFFDNHDRELALSTDHIKAVIKDIFAAGSETSATTLEWAMSELIRNPDVMRKAQTEVTEVLGTGGGSRQTSSTTQQASMSTASAQGGVDEGEFEEVMRSKLRYLQMVIKETLRLHPPVPLLLPRECQKSCQVMGYQIPAKARVMVNVWAIGRDPTYWRNPEAFCPERFDQNSPVVDFKGAHFEFTPFGAGRRICPGMQFGLAMLELALANLLYYFDWEYSGEEEGEELDMSDSFGLTARRRFPLRLRAIPRAI